MTPLEIGLSVVVVVLLWRAVPKDRFWSLPVVGEVHVGFDRRSTGPWLDIYRNDIPGDLFVRLGDTLIVRSRRVLRARQQGA